MKLNIARETKVDKIYVIDVKCSLHRIKHEIVSLLGCYTCIDWILFVLTEMLFNSSHMVLFYNSFSCKNLVVAWNDIGAICGCHSQFVVYFDKHISDCKVPQLDT